MMMIVTNTVCVDLNIQNITLINELVVWAS